MVVRLRPNARRPVFREEFFFWLGLFDGMNNLPALGDCLKPRPR